jgi:hypothetical protein
MTDKNNQSPKIAIIIGAGASADFFPKEFSFPVGEALIKNICNKKEIASFFWNEICESFQNIFIKKFLLQLKEKPSDRYREILHFTQQYTTNIERLFHSHNLFCDFLKNEINKLDSNFLEIKNMFYEYSKKENLDNGNFIFQLGKDGVYELLDLLYKNFNVNEEDLSDNEKKDKNCHLFYKIICANSNSRYLHISALVNYYQPFSIDELLDSINNDKIDYLDCLKINEEDLKEILNISAEDLKNYEDEDHPEILKKLFKNELIKAGKSLIALFLLRSEKKDLFNNPNPETDAKIWYRHIRNLIITSGNDSAEIKEKIKNITIISFNYDRSLDYYLRAKLKKEYYDAIKEQIFYPYGKLAKDNWDYNDYGSFAKKDNYFKHYNEIENMGKGLKVIGEIKEEEVSTQNELSEIQKNLSESSKIYFLGFAFHEANCRLLALDKFSTSCDQINIYYTNLAESSSIDQVVKKIFKSSTKQSKKKVNDQFIINSSRRKGVYNALIDDFKLIF